MWAHVEPGDYTHDAAEEGVESVPEEGEPPVGEELLRQQIAAHAAKMAEVRARARAIEAEEAEMEVKMAALQAQLTC